MNTAIIVAAGQGSRMGGTIRKPYLPLGGVPVIGRTLETFTQSRFFEDIILVVAAADVDHCRQYVLDRLGLRRVVHIVAGGRERQESVFNGLAASRGAADSLVLIHDGVRPFVSIGDLRRCLNAASHHGACVLGAKANDTLKEVGPDGKVRRTIPRKDVWLAQTPQGFHFDLIMTAHVRAREEGFSGTDDVQLVERLGHPVAMVPGSPWNIKITTPDDLRLAEIIWRYQQDSPVTVPALEGNMPRGTN